HVAQCVQEEKGELSARGGNLFRPCSRFSSVVLLPLELRAPRKDSEWFKPPEGCDQLRFWSRFLGRVYVRAHQMQRDVGLVADDPAVMAWRAGRDIKDVTCTHFDDRAAFDGHGSATGNDDAHVLDVAKLLAGAWADVLG